MKWHRDVAKTFVTTLVTHIKQNTATEHIVFMYKSSVYILVRDRSSLKKHLAVQHMFQTFEEAKGFMNGYITAQTQFDSSPAPVYMEVISIDGYTTQNH